VYCIINMYRGILNMYRDLINMYRDLINMYRDVLINWYHHVYGVRTTGHL